MIIYSLKPKEWLQKISASISWSSMFALGFGNKTFQNLESANATACHYSPSLEMLVREKGLWQQWGARAKTELFAGYRAYFRPCSLLPQLEIFESNWSNICCRLFANSTFSFWVLMCLVIPTLWSMGLKKEWKISFMSLIRWPLVSLVSMFVRWITLKFHPLINKASKERNFNWFTLTLKTLCWKSWMHA